MRYFLGTALMLLATLPTLAEAKSPPPQLSQKEISDGWILLFDGETTFGGAVDGTAKVADGVLTLGGDKPTKAGPTTAFRHFELVVESNGVGQLVFDNGTGQSSLGLSNQNSVLNLKAEAGPENGQSLRGEGKVGAAGAARIKATYEYGGPNPVRFRFEVPAGGKLEVRSVKLRPLGLKSIFNGKDLTGWKKFDGDKARARSEFSVTSEGWLNVKDGRGDLQTDGQWADFVLQFDCISNGQHLNSGVFFRCRPGEYQNGYEAQVRNEFTDEAKQEYTVEEYDPKSHELKARRKVKSPAVDYGTGAIYRRQPARKQMSKDGEWFTMTVVAQGRHLATWVNGVQVTDWTDNRPLQDNARNGCRLEKGPISLQGHDPKTDLSFRNFRVAELSR